MSRTYRKGQQIETLIDCLAFVLAGANFCIPGGNNTDRIVPAAFIYSWQLSTINKNIKAGRLHLAEKR